jgi:Icc protein
MKTFNLLLLFAGVIAGCNSFEYSPDQTFDRDSPTDLNQSAITELLSGNQHNDTIKFVLSGDTQRSYKEIPSFIEKVNSIDNLDFILVAGDITEFGSYKEMEGYARRIKAANVPVITVVGNHDLTGRGTESYKRMFGALNFSFIYKRTKFVCHDTNSREYKFNGQVPNMNWLEQQLKPEANVNAFVAVAHVPALSDDFDQKLVPSYADLFQKTPRFLAGLYGHTHTYITSPTKSPYPFLVTGTVGESEFILVTIINNKLTHERIFF